MKKEIFLRVTASTKWTTADEVTVNEIIRRLDEEGYWDNEFITGAVLQQKKSHVRRQMRQLKDENGWPFFAHIVRVDENGEEKHFYKQETLFDTDDYRQTINYHVATGQHHIRMAIGYRDHAFRRYAVQIPLPFEFTDAAEQVA